MVYVLDLFLKLVESMILLTFFAVVLGVLSYLQNKEFSDEDPYYYIWDFIKVIFPFL